LPTLSSNRRLQLAADEPLEPLEPLDGAALLVVDDAAGLLAALESLLEPELEELSPDPLVDEPPEESADDDDDDVDDELDPPRLSVL
jgi:hypothetical protein